MQANMGTIDRVVRVAVALIVAGLIISGVLQGLWAILFGVLAVIFVATSAISFCPLYLPFKLNTRGQTNSKR